MKRLFQFVLVCSMFMLTACSGGALKFNNKIVELQKDLEGKVTELSGKMDGADSVKTRALLPEMKSIVSYIDEKTAELKKLEGPEDGAAFKKSMVEQFEFLKKLYQQNIRFIEDKLTDDERTKLAVEIQAMVPEASRLEDETIKAQQAFAKKNGITLK